MVRHKTDFTNIKCFVCGKDLTQDNHPCREYDKEGNGTGRWLCISCYGKTDRKNNPNNLDNKKKLVRNCRTGNQYPDSANAKASKSQELACRLYGWEDLNKKYDNYKSPVDCRDPKTGLYHQVQGHYYNSRNWPFANLENEWKKTFEDMVCFCISKDGKMVERIYRFPKKEIDIRKSIGVYKNPTDARGNPIVSWYDKYRITDEEVLKKTNDIWKEILIAYA